MVELGIRAVFRNLALLSALLLNMTARADAPATRPVPDIRRAVIISIDGLRPDLALRARMPHLRRMMDRGAYTFWARTTERAETLPSHASMLTGVVPDRHGVVWNKDQTPQEQQFTMVPTLFESARRAGYTTAMAVGKSKLCALAKPGSLDWSFIPEEQTTDDRTVTREAVKILKRRQPRILFVHLPSVDHAGHAVGWGSPQQIDAIERADSCIGAILEAIEDRKLSRETLVIVTADHGGAARQHGPNDPRSRHIPWLAVGPGVCHNLDLTLLRDLVIDTEDTCATVHAAMGITPLIQFDGKPIREIFQPAELLKDDPSATQRLNDSMTQ